MKRKLDAPAPDRAAWHKFDRTLTPTTQRKGRTEKAPADVMTAVVDVVEKTWWFKIWVGSNCSWEQVESHRSSEGSTNTSPFTWQLTYMIAKCNRLSLFDTIQAKTKGMHPDLVEQWARCFQDHASTLKELRAKLDAHPEEQSDREALDKCQSDATAFAANLNDHM